MNYKGKSRRKSNMISFAQVQKHATLNNIIFRDANTMVNNKEKQEFETALPLNREGKEYDQEKGYTREFKGNAHFLFLNWVTGHR